MKKALALMLIFALAALTGCGSDVATASVPLDGYVESEPVSVEVSPIDLTSGTDPLTQAIAGLAAEHVFCFGYSAPGAVNVEVRLYELDGGTWHEFFTPVQFPLPAEDGGIVLLLNECFGSGISYGLYSAAGLGMSGVWSGSESVPQSTTQYIIPLSEERAAMTGDNIPVALQVFENGTGSSGEDAIGLDNFFDTEPLMDKAATYAVTLCFR